MVVRLQDRYGGAQKGHADKQKSRCLFLLFQISGLKVTIVFIGSNNLTFMIFLYKFILGNVLGARSLLGHSRHDGPPAPDAPVPVRQEVEKEEEVQERLQPRRAHPDQGEPGGGAGEGRAEQRGEQQGQLRLRGADGPAVQGQTTQVGRGDGQAVLHLRPRVVSVVAIGTNQDGDQRLRSVPCCFKRPDDS